MHKGLGQGPCSGWAGLKHHTGTGALVADSEERRLDVGWLLMPTEDSAREVPAPARPQGPPILVGSSSTGERMLRLSARHADIWNRDFDAVNPWVSAVRHQGLDRFSAEGRRRLRPRSGATRRAWRAPPASGSTSPERRRAQAGKPCAAPKTKSLAACAATPTPVTARSGSIRRRSKAWKRWRG